MKIFVMKLGEIAANCYVILDEKSGDFAVMDPGDCTPELHELINSEGFGAFRYILLTHGHYDHIFGVHELKSTYHVPVAIHALDSAKLTDERQSLATHAQTQKQVPVDADILLSEGDVINIGDIKLRVMHTPGHSAGGVCFVCDEEKVIFSGDTLFCRTIGRTDFYDGSLDKLLESVLRLSELEGYTVYPGHNRATTIDDEKAKNRFLRKLK